MLSDHYVSSERIGQTSLRFTWRLHMHGMACALILTTSAAAQAPTRNGEPARAVEAHASTVDTSAARAQQFARMKLLAQHRDVVPVLVQFAVPDIQALTATSRNAPNRVEAAQEDAKLRTAIAQVVERELGNLAGVEYRLNRMFVTIPFAAMSVSQAAISRLEESPAVLNIEEDSLARPTLDNTVGIVGATTAFAQGFDGTGWYIAVLDSGIRDTHEFFAGKDIEQACFARGQDGQVGTGDCPNGSSSDTVSADAARIHSTPPNEDHGTHVAGIAAGDGPGVPSSGVARGADLIAVQVFSQFRNTTDCDPNNQVPMDCVMSWQADQIAALEFVYAQRTTLNIASVNMSLGGGHFTSEAACDASNTSLKAVIDNLRSDDIATIVAAGNERFCDGLSQPACISSAVAVGAVTDSDAEAWFSNYDPNQMLDLYAPGVSILSATGTGDSSYGNKSGTSMATPHVAGAWAILKQADPGANVDQILNALTTTGAAVAGRCIAAPAQRRIRIDAALNAVGGNTPPVLSNPRVTPIAGTESTLFDFMVDYYDADGDPPHLDYRIAYVTSDTCCHGGDMVRISGAPSNGTYRFRTQLDVGAYSYSFFFADPSYASDQTPWRGGPDVFVDDIPVTVHVDVSGGPLSSCMDFSAWGWGGRVDFPLDHEPITFTVPAGPDTEIWYDGDSCCPSYSCDESQLYINGSHVVTGTCSRWFQPGANAEYVDLYLSYTYHEETTYAISGAVLLEGGAPVPGGVDVTLDSPVQHEEPSPTSGTFSFQP